MPGTLNPIGLSNIAPAIIEHGTDAQKRDLLPRMLRGDDIWCQGFSEPNAGSDLASLRTSAVRDGDCWIVNGQKTWNTLGGSANWCELLVRTDPSVPKHKGITCLLVDMTLPGIDVRPLLTITGDNDFNEIFFTDVRVPVDCTLGPVDEGWRVAMTTLAYERGGVAKLHTGTRAKIARLIDDARTTPLGDGRMATDDPVLREKLAVAYLDGELLKLISDRALSAELHGRPMGPEGSIAKLLWSETEQHVTELASDILGPDALERALGARSRLQPGNDDRGRHDAGEQEHPRPTHAGVAAALSRALSLSRAFGRCASRASRPVPSGSGTRRTAPVRPRGPRVLRPRSDPAPWDSGCETGNRSGAPPVTGSHRRAPVVRRA